MAAVTRKDLKVLAEVAKASTKGFEFMDAAVLEAQSFGDPGYDGSFFLQAMEAGKAVGFILGVARRKGDQKQGHVKFFCVNPKFRRKHIGNDLFSEIERRFQKRETREINLGLCPFPYLMSGVNSLDTASVCFLLSRGYERQGDVVDMAADLGKAALTLSPEELKVAKEAKVRKAKLPEFDTVFEPVRKAFPWWQAEIKAGLENGSVYVAEREGQVVAFAACNACNPGWFGPMGTVETERGHGLGKILLFKCLETLKKGGAKSAVIPWVGPIPYYARHAAASISRVGWHFIKRV